MKQGKCNRGGAEEDAEKLMKGRYLLSAFILRDSASPRLHFIQPNDGR